MSVISVDSDVREDYLVSTRASKADRQADPQLREYWERGYIALRGLFSPMEVAAWSAECDRLLASEHVFHGNIRSPFRMNSGDKPERIDPAVDISPVFQSLANDRRITDVVGAIFEDRPLLFKDKVIFKSPGTDGYTMHQDQAYWQLCPADDILSVSIQVDGASAANGCIELFPGYHERLFTPPQKRMQMRPEDIAQMDLSTGEKIETRPGDVLIFHSLAPHCSGRNTDTVSRRSLYLTYSAARNGDFYDQQLKNYIAYNRNETLTTFR